MVSPWASAIIGILMVVWVLYQGIPRVMQPDPTHAFGLYLSAMFVVVLTTSIARVLPGLFLLGVVDFKNSWLTHKFPALLQ
jgi:Co/Zn/Cd efflux system component